MTARDDERAQRSARLVQEGGLPWPWLLAATILVGGAMALGLPRLLPAEPGATSVALPAPAPGATPGGNTVPGGSGGGSLPAPGTGSLPLPPRSGLIPAEPAAAAPVADTTPRLEPAQAKPLVDVGGALVIDARVHTAYLEAHLPGAINVTPLEAPVWARRPDPGKPIIVYCD